MKSNIQKQLRVTIPQLLSVSIFVVIVFLPALFTGCRDLTITPCTSGQITMTSQYSPVTSIGKLVPRNVVRKIMTIDSLRITRARFVLKEIKYKTKSESSSFRETPFVLELNLSSVIQNISLSDLPFGSYREVEYDVHCIEMNDVISLPSSEQVQFRDFAAAERYSIIISGKIYSGGQSIVFTFRSRVSSKHTIGLSPEIIIGEPLMPVNATMFINSGGWFRSVSGDLLDPSDSQNENVISDNVRASINVFKDNNKDGRNDIN